MPNSQSSFERLTYRLLMRARVSNPDKREPHAHLGGSVTGRGEERRDSSSSLGNSSRCAAMTAAIQRAAARLTAVLPDIRPASDWTSTQSLRLLINIKE